MLNGSMLDVAIGMVLLFLVASLIASAIVEAVAGFLHRRQKHLWDTLDLLLGNTSIADDDAAKKIVRELYKQPFITGLVRPTDRAKFDPAEPAAAVATPATAASTATAAAAPARAQALHVPKLSKGAGPPKTRAADEDLKRRFYGPQHIEPREFANALLSYIRPGIAHVGTAGDIQAELMAGIATLPADLREKLTAVVAGTGNSFAEIRQGVEDWFDRSMAAASAWYRKQTRWFLFLAGLVLAVTLNIDAVHATATLYRDDGARTELVKIAEQVGAVTCPTKSSNADGTTTDSTNATDIDLNCVRDKVGGSISLPIGWTDADKTATGWFVRALGWLLVGCGVTLGAPFWFDLLRRALNVRRNQGGAK